MVIQNNFVPICVTPHLMGHVDLHRLSKMPPPIAEKSNQIASVQGSNIKGKCMQVHVAKVQGKCSVAYRVCHIASPAFLVTRGRVALLYFLTFRTNAQASMSSIADHSFRPNLLMSFP